MPRYLPTVATASEMLENTRGFYPGDGTRNGNGFSSGLSATASSGSAVSSSSSKSKK